MSMSSYTCTHSSRVGTTMSALTPCAGFEPEPLDDGDAEAEGLAGAGLGLADDVLAGEAEGDGLLLDGECVDDAFGGESLDDVLVHAEFGEGRHDESLSGR